MRNSIQVVLFLWASLLSLYGETVRPNFLVIVVDDLRAWGEDSSLAGVETPSLDRLASEGRLFSHTYAAYAVCGPSRNSFLSGLRPETTGALLNTHHSIRAFIPRVRTLPAWFKEHGYVTVGMGKLFHSDQDRSSWTSFFDFPGHISGYQASDGKPSTEFLDRPDVLYPDGWMTETAVGWLQEQANRDQPFLLMVGLLKPHLPFVAPRSDLDAVAAPAAPAPEEMPDGAPGYAGHNGYELRSYGDIPQGNEPIDPTKASELRQGYAACLRFIDRQVGRILEGLEASGQADRTHVILFGDHGFHLGENGFWCKDSVYETSLRTSLLFRPAPGVKGGQVPLPASTEPIELGTLYPTMLALAGLPAPYRLDSRSLLDDESPGVAFSMVQRHSRMIGFSVRDARYRYTRWLDMADGEQKAEELYDYADAAPESRNLARVAALAEVRQRLSNLMDRHLEASRYASNSPEWGRELRPPQD